MSLPQGICSYTDTLLFNHLGRLVIAPLFVVADVVGDRKLV